MRATGIVSLLLLTLVVALGVATSNRFRPRGQPRGDDDAAPQRVAARGRLPRVHVLTAVIDPDAAVGLFAVVVPFAGRLRAVLGRPRRARARARRRARRHEPPAPPPQPPSRGAAIHWLAYAAWPLALMHGIGMGTDAATRLDARGERRLHRSRRRRADVAPARRAGPPRRARRSSQRAHRNARRASQPALRNRWHAEAMNGSRPRILVVDDEPSIVDAVATALRYEGFDVDEASTGREALAAVDAARARPDRARLDAPGHRGHRGRPPAARAGLQDADPLPDREGRDREQGRGAARRRRRLRDEAVQPRRGRRADRRRSCAARAASFPATCSASATSSLDEARHEVHRGETPIQLTATEFCAAALLHAQPAPRALEGRRSSRTSGATTSAATRTSSRRTSATCAASSTPPARR